VLAEGVHVHCLGVNGPLIAAHGEAVALVWTTLHEHEDEGLVAIHMAMSTDAGDRFSAPLELGRGARLPVAVALDAQQVWVLWLQEEENKMVSLWLSRRSLDMQEEYERRELARLPDPFDTHPAQGFPRFALSEGIGWLVWNTGTSLRGLKIQPPQ